MHLNDLGDAVGTVQLCPSCAESDPLPQTDEQFARECTRFPVSNVQPENSKTAEAAPAKGRYRGLLLLWLQDMCDCTSWSQGA